jgi:3-oxoacyl-[acyl-carrier-protein] synthase-3
MKITANHLVIPRNKISTQRLLLEDDKSPPQIKSTIENTGFLELRYATSSIDRFLEASTQSLSADFIRAIPQVKLVIVATQSYETTSPPHSAKLQSLFRLPFSVLCIDIVEACNGFVKAAALADNLLKPGECALIVTGEMNSRATQSAATSLKILLADGFSFTIVQREKAAAKYLIRTDGSRGGALKTTVNPPLATMDGLAVFSFTHTEIPKLIKESDWINLEEKNLYSFHQANKYIVEKIAKRLKIDPVLPIFNFSDIGNIGGATVPGWVAKHGTEIAKHNGRLLHNVGFGTGLSWGLISTRLDITANSVLEISA